MRPDASDILEQVRRMGASEEFRSKPLLQKFLTYLVTEYVEGRSDHIKGYSIAVDVFGQGTDFDADRNPLVRNNAVRLRALLRTYYLEEGKNDPIRIRVPKGRYVPDITSSNEDGTAAPQTTSNAPPPSVAVLPFGNLTGETHLDYLATGFSQELSDTLTKFEDFRVIGVGQRDDDGESARTEVDPLTSGPIRFLIDGDLQASGAQAKVRFRLIDTSDHSRVWGDGFKFDSRESDLFERQEKLARQIANHVCGEYGQINQRRYQAILQSKPRSLSEQDVLLKYYHHTTVLTPESASELQEAVFEALQRDPDSCLLNTLAGNVYCDTYAMDFPGADEARAKFGDHVEKAYSINANHQLVRSSLASKCFFFDEKQRLLRLLDGYEEWTASSPMRLGGLALWTCLFGEWERGRPLLDKVLDNNAHVPGWLHGIASLDHYRRFEYEEALDEANKYHIPGLFWGPLHRAVALSQLGRLEEARREFQALLETRPNFVERGRYLMSMIIKDASVLEHLMDGLGKIGVKLA